MKDLLNNIIDNVNEGLIVIDNDGIIRCYNKKAKEIFGVIYNQGIGHSSGQLSFGDIVIIGDNSFGADDGGLEAKDLQSIGIETSHLKKGDAFLAIGKVGAKIGTGILEISKKQKNQLELDVIFEKHQIKAEIDFINKMITIIANKKSFPYQYIKALGHMIIISAETGEIKFYQAKGYTFRREAVKDILNGKNYASKGENSGITDILGKNIYEVHPKESNMNIVEFLEAARGKDISYKNEVKEINGRPTRCSLVRINEEDDIQGALLKVEDISELINAIKERDIALASLNEAENRLRGEEGFEDIIGQSECIKAVKRLCKKASETDSTILILGESGTGKGLLAGAIHKNSNRKENPFVYVNCTSIPNELLESELFGYEGGSFTGARKEGKKGLFEAADGGTIFLDEIGEISQFMQVKLLHVIQNKSFMRVGGTKEIHANVKIISATNLDLDKAVEQGLFRKDLYYRINVFPIYLPPLRMRRDDIYPLILHLLPQICNKVKMPEKLISAEAIKMLIEYEWPGNVRELENVIERAVNIMEGDTIYPEHLNLKWKTLNEKIMMEVRSMSDFVADAEKTAIERALKAANGNKNEAMRILEIGKTSFYDKIKRYGIK